MEFQKHFLSDHFGWKTPHRDAFVLEEFMCKWKGKIGRRWGWQMVSPWHLIRQCSMDFVWISLATPSVVKRTVYFFCQLVWPARQKINQCQKSIHQLREHSENFRKKFLWAEGLRKQLFASAIMSINYENFFKIPEKARKNPFPHLQSWFASQINQLGQGVNKFWNSHPKTLHSLHL